MCGRLCFQCNWRSSCEYVWRMPVAFTYLWTSGDCTKSTHSTLQMRKSRGQCSSCAAIEQQKKGFFWKALSISQRTPKRGFSDNRQIPRHQWGTRACSSPELIWQDEDHKVSNRWRPWDWSQASAEPCCWRPHRTQRGKKKQPSSPQGKQMW